MDGMRERERWEGENRLRERNKREIRWGGGEKENKDGWNERERDGRERTGSERETRERGERTNTDRWNERETGKMRERERERGQKVACKEEMLDNLA